jgi:hypothetical protein
LPKPAKDIALKTVASLRHLLALFCGLALLSLPARAAVLIHEYALRNSLADNKGGPVLTSLGGQITALGYVFSSSQGVSLAAPSLSATDYSLEFSFKLNSTVGNIKLLDLHGLTDTTGLYSADGRLSFEPGTKAVSASIVAGSNTTVVITRSSATNVVTAYINGQSVFSFTDINSAAVLASNRQLLFFRDQLTLNPNGTLASGTLNYLRVFNGALTSTEVSALFAAGAPLSVPEPSTAALMVTGLAVFAVALRRRRRR